MSYLVFPHQAWAEVSGVKLQTEGRFMVLLSALDSEAVAENNCPAENATSRAAGRTWNHLSPYSPREQGHRAEPWNVLQVLGKQLLPLKCYKYNHLTSSDSIAHR